MKNPLCIVSIFTILDSLETDNVLASLPLAYCLTFRRRFSEFSIFQAWTSPKNSVTTRNLRDYALLSSDDIILLLFE